MEEGLNFSTQQARRRAIPLRLVAIAALAAFLLGVLLTWMVTREGDFAAGDLFRIRSEQAAPTTDELASLPAPPAPSPAATQESEAGSQEARETAERVEEVVEQQGGLDQRVAAMEQRLTRLDLQSQAAAGNAARAEGLLVAFAARRAIERGSPLGYLEDQLRLRFGDARPNSVQTVIDAAADPVTLEQLLARLDGLAPVLGDAPANQGVLSRIGSELSQLFVIRTDDTPSPVSERRLERARLFLESGRIESAVSEIRNTANAEEASDWLADAERFAAAQRALEALESAAILEPRDLRDGSGNRVEQLSPAAAPPVR